MNANLVMSGQSGFAQSVQRNKTMDYVTKSRGRIGIVTVTYNSGRVLEKFLGSLSAQTYRNFLLFAVDSGSTDNSIEQLEAWADERLRIIPNAVNVGIAEGDNQGILAARAENCEYVLILNNDVEFEPETFAILVMEIEALQCDLLTPKILFEDRIHLCAAGGVFNPFKGYFGTPVGWGERDHGQYETRRRIENACGCCILVRDSVFEKVGMMDVKYFVYHEDADFLFRTKRARMTAFYTPAARIFHKGSALTGGISSPFSVRYSTRGHVYFMLKNLGLTPCLFYLPALQLRMCIKVLFGLMSWNEFKIRQRAFCEGVAVWAS